MLAILADSLISVPHGNEGIDGFLQYDLSFNVKRIYSFNSTTDKQLIKAKKSLQTFLERCMNVAKAVSSTVILHAKMEDKDFPDRPAQ